MASVYSDLMKVRPSAILAVYGSSSLTHAPDFAVLRELEFRRHDRKARLRRRHAGEPLALAHRFGQVLALKFDEAGLVVEQLHLRRSARLERDRSRAWPWERNAADREAAVDLRAGRSASSGGRANRPARPCRCRLAFRPKKCRRVICRPMFLVVHALLLRNGLVEIQNQARDGGVGREFARIELCPGSAWANRPDLRMPSRPRASAR